jgi:hypothetical protein
MPWIIEDGRPVRVSVRSGLTPPEVTAKTDVPTADEFSCPICAKTYKTERGLANHIESHTEEE